LETKHHFLFNPEFPRGRLRQTNNYKLAPPVSRKIKTISLPADHRQHGNSAFPEQEHFCGLWSQTTAASKALATHGHFWYF